MHLWKITTHEKEITLNQPVVVVGLPGIGHVGKLVADFIIQEMKPKKMMTFLSPTFPHSVFINEKNLVELPEIRMYGLKHKKQDFLILTGDIQPTDEVASHEFGDIFVQVCAEHKAKEIITLGGIGLPDEPKSPRLFVAANDEKLLKRFQASLLVEKSVHGLVGPVVGLTGLLVASAQQKKIPAACVLAETVGHPLYFGVSGSKKMLALIKEQYGLSLPLDKLAKEVRNVEKEMMVKRDQLIRGRKKPRSQELPEDREINYIG